MCNYGGAYFFLDRLFGTFRSPDDEIAERAAGKLKKVAQQPYGGPAEPVAPAPSASTTTPEATSKLKAS
jgi:sterol desaturase/sphingolipid hydroxylase (fatty acid hydroxylase superfamily)